MYLCDVFVNANLWCNLFCEFCGLQVITKKMTLRLICVTWNLSDLLQVPSPSLFCRAKLCSEMSTTSTKTCLSGGCIVYIGTVHYYVTCSLTPLLLTGYRMASSYFAGGKCITQNRNSTVSKSYGNKVFAYHEWFILWVVLAFFPHGFLTSFFFLSINHN